MNELLSAPVWLFGGMLAFILLAICGTNQMYQRAVGLIRAIRGESDEQPDVRQPLGPPTS